MAALATSGPSRATTSASSRSPRAVDEALHGWEPDPDQIEVAVAAAAVIAINTVVGDILDAPILHGAARPVRRAGHQHPGPQPGRRSCAAQDLADVDGMLARLDAIGDGTDRLSAGMALMWAAHHLENVGDPEGAIEEAARGLAMVSDEDGPWIGALLRTLLAGLNAQLGKRAEAAAYARGRAARSSTCSRPTTTSIQVRALLACQRDQRRRLRRRRALTSTRSSASAASGRASAAIFVSGLTRAELALARGEVAGGAAPLPRRGGGAALDHPVPGDGRADRRGAVGAVRRERRRHGVRPARQRRRRPRPATRRCAAKVAEGAGPGSGPTWTSRSSGRCSTGWGPGGCSRTRMPAEDAVRLLVLADLFAYAAAHASTMSPERTVRLAEADALPGWSPGSARSTANARARTSCAEARAVAERIARVATSCGCRTAPRAARRSRPRRRSRAAPSRPVAVTSPSFIRSRIAVMTCETGLTFDEGLQPARQRLGRDERVGQERQREHDHHRDALHAPGRCGRWCRAR